MRRGGILDGFPVHLFLNGDSGTAIILDDCGLGCLPVNNVPGGNRITVAVSRNFECLEQTANMSKENGENKVYCVQADSKMLPFRHQSVNCIVIFSRAEHLFSRNRLPEQLDPLINKQLMSLLAPNGSLVKIAPAHDQGPVKACPDAVPQAVTRSYFVRPSTGDQYFVTHHWTPPSWPFKALQIGKLRGLRMAVDLLISRLGVRPLYDCAIIQVQNSSGESVFWEDWSKNTQSLSQALNFGVFIKARRNAIVLGAEGAHSGEELIAKFPLSVATASQQERHLNALESLAKTVNPEILQTVPKVVLRGEMDGQSYSLETKCLGTTASNFWYVPGSRKKATQVGYKFLLKLHSSTREPTKIDRATYDRLLNPHRDAIRKRLATMSPKFDITPLVELLWRMFQGVELPLVFTHGDFCVENLIVAKGMTLTGVPDWEASVTRGWPMLDLINLFATYNKAHGTKSLGLVVLKKLIPQTFSPWQDVLLDDYSKCIGLSREYWIGFVLLYWIERVSLDISTLCDDDWLQRNVIEPLPALMDRLQVGLSIKN